MSYSDEVLADSPLIYLKLDETSGTTAVDSSGNGRNGTHGAGVTVNQPSLLVDGTGKSALYSTASTSRTTIPYALWMSVAHITVEARIQPDTNAVDAGDNIIASRLGPSATGDSGRSWFFRLTGGKVNALIRRAGLAEVAVSGSTTLTAGTRYTVAMTFDGSALRLWVNGVLDGSLSATGFLTTPTTDLLIGDFAATSTGHFSGLIDEVSLYNGALSDTRLLAHHNAAVATPGPQIAFAAIAPPAAAVFDLSRTLPEREITLAGTAPAASATFTLEHAEPAPPVNEVAFTAIAPAAVATLDLAHLAPIDLAFAATAPAATASFLLDAETNEPTITFAAFAPAAVAAFTLAGPVIGRTDLTSDVSEGYNYGGESDVLDDGSTGSIPAGIRLAPIRIVHQSVPAPVLVNGRPT